MTGHRLISNLFPFLRIYFVPYWFFCFRSLRPLSERNNSAVDVMRFSFICGASDLVPYKRSLQQKLFYLRE